jgi:hypothetical protein
MDYQTLDSYRYTWFYKHQEMPVSDDDLLTIKPLVENRSNQLWHQLVSKNANHPDLFAKEDWPAQPKTWINSANWQKNWDSDDALLPDEIDEHISWEMNTVVYFCYHADHIVETTWEMFSKYWKNFLFLDNGPILIGKRRKEVIQFLDDGSFKIGLKPDAL